MDYFEWLAALLDWHRVQQCPDWAAWSEEVFQSFESGGGKITKQDLERLLCGDEGCKVGTNY